MSQDAPDGQLTAALGAQERIYHSSFAGLHAYTVRGGNNSGDYVVRLDGVCLGWFSPAVGRARARLVISGVSDHRGNPEALRVIKAMNEAWASGVRTPA